MEPSSEKESLCLRVFAIPELAGIICRLVRKRDNASLLRVCRQLFYDVCPFVWESTDATVTLVSMIPGGGITLIGDDPFPQLEVMQFPSVLDLSRLQVYAPHIRHLEIPLDQHTDEYDNWEGFLAATRSTPLLPNLEHIRFALKTDFAEESFNWVTAFLSPSLLSLRIAPPAVYFGESVPDYALVNFKLAQRLLHKIAEQCPRVNLLEIYPKNAEMQPYRPDSRDYSRTENAIDVDLSYPSPEIPSIISRFQCLRTLTTTAFVLDTDAFIVLARLPLLESLTVYGVHSRVCNNDLTLPDQSFMSLRHLELSRITWGTIHNLCRQASLWQGLRTVRIHGFTPYSWPEEGDPPHLLSGIISSLADYRAPITALTLNGSNHQRMSCQMADSLTHLPLNSLSLGSFDSDHTHLKNMLDALQPLEELKMHVFPGLHLPQLRMIITSLPRLRKLSIHVDYDALDVLRMEDIIPSQTQSQGSLCLASNIHLSQTYHENLEKIARYLYALKPDIVYAAFGDDVHFTNGVHWCNPTDVLINKALSRLREESAGGQSPPDFRAIVSEHMYRPDW